MQVDSRWAEPVVSNLASVPFDGNHQQQIALTTTHSLPSQPPLIAPNFFPPQRVEPVDMPRHQQQVQHMQHRNKIGYTRSATTDEQQVTNFYMQNVPIKRVQHPADRSSIVKFLKRLSKVGFALFISIPCVILITLIIPISWIIRTCSRFICRYHCTVTPCTCSYLSASDLFWLYNNNTTINRTKTDETTKLNSQTIAPIAAAIFFLEGNKRFSNVFEIIYLILIKEQSMKIL
jgi:hypothetical protein